MYFLAICSILIPSLTILILLITIDAIEFVSICRYYIDVALNIVCDFRATMVSANLASWSIVNKIF